MKQNKNYIKTVYLPIYKVLFIKMYSHSNIPRSEPSIFVENMHNSTKVDHITKTFQSLGKIAKVEFNYCGNFKQATVHFKYWYENSDADSARVVLLRKEELLVMHKLGEYWTTTPALTRIETFKRDSNINFDYEINTLDLIEENAAFMEYEYSARNSETHTGFNYENAVSPPRRKQIAII
jgi:hypothetical protein